MQSKIKVINADKFINIPNKIANKASPLAIKHILNIKNAHGTNHFKLELLYLYFSIPISSLVYINFNSNNFFPSSLLSVAVFISARLNILIITEREFPLCCFIDPYYYSIFR